jgi:hypothetical protein
MFRQKTEQRTKRGVRAIAAIVALGAFLAGCSDIYYARRDTIALSGGDAVAANMVEQMVDPWPANSGNTSIAFNGQKMQSAVERYRTDKVTQPINPTTSEVENMQQQAAAAATAAASQTPPAPVMVAPSGVTTPAQ